jgi:hypothetical protein
MGVPDTLRGLRQFIRMMPGMQVRPTNTTAQHIQQNLALAGLWLSHILNLKVTVVANNSFHGYFLSQSGLH